MFIIALLVLNQIVWSTHITISPGKLFATAIQSFFQGHFIVDLGKSFHWFNVVKISGNVLYNYVMLHPFANSKYMKLLTDVNINSAERVALYLWTAIIPSLTVTQKCWVPLSTVSCISPYLKIYWKCQSMNYNIYGSKRSGIE